MGIFNGRDLLSAKFTTAIITDVGGHAYFIPIKNVMGDFFLAEIEKEIYCFKIDSTRECDKTVGCIKEFFLGLYVYQAKAFWRPIQQYA